MVNISDYESEEVVRLGVSYLDSFDGDTVEDMSRDEVYDVFNERKGDIDKKVKENTEYMLERDMITEKEYNSMTHMGFDERLVKFYETEKDVSDRAMEGIISNIGKDLKELRKDILISLNIDRDRAKAYEKTEKLKEVVENAVDTYKSADEYYTENLVPSMKSSIETIRGIDEDYEPPLEFEEEYPDWKDFV